MKDRSCVTFERKHWTGSRSAWGCERGRNEWENLFQLLIELNCTSIVPHTFALCAITLSFILTIKHSLLHPQLFRLTRNKKPARRLSEKKQHGMVKHWNLLFVFPSSRFASCVKSYFICRKTYLHSETEAKKLFAKQIYKIDFPLASSYTLRAPRKRLHLCQCVA